MIHTKKCPHCKYIVGSGHGDPFKHLGSPIKKCPQCKNVYVDTDMVEWAISPAYRKLGYCFANNRIWLCLLPSMILGAAAESLLRFVVCFSAIFAACCLYVKKQVDEAIELSKERAKDKEYVKFLVSAGYPVRDKIDQ